MQDPRSKTVKGLGIAVVVLSALSLLVSFGVLAVGAGVMASAEDTAAETTQALQENGLSDEIGNLLDATQGLDSKTLVALSEYLSSLDVKQAQKLGDAVAQKDVKAITKIVNKTSESLTKTQKSIVLDAFTNLSKSNSKAIGDVLKDMDEQDLKDATELMLSMSNGSLSQIIGGALSEDQDLTNEDIQQKLTANIIGLGGGLVFALGITGLVAALLSLFAGILAIRNCANPAKLTAAFVLSILAAVCAFFIARLVSMVLLIVMAVYVAKLRSLRYRPDADGSGSGTAVGGSAAAAYDAGDAPVPPQA